MDTTQLCGAEQVMLTRKKSVTVEDHVIQNLTGSWMKDDGLEFLTCLFFFCLSLTLFSTGIPSSDIKTKENYK